jgi:hypothetical protein
MKLIFKQIGLLKKTVIIFTLIVVIVVTGWQVNTHKHLEKINNYDALAAISSDIIIYYQENKASKWKEYVAMKQTVISVMNNDPNALNYLELLLDQGKSFEKIDWQKYGKDMKKTAAYYYQIIDQSSILDPGEYTFPFCPIS